MPESQVRGGIADLAHNLILALLHAFRKNYMMAEACGGGSKVYLTAEKKQRRK